MIDAEQSTIGLIQSCTPHLPTRNCSVQYRSGPVQGASGAVQCATAKEPLMIDPIMNVADSLPDKLWLTSLCAGVVRGFEVGADFGESEPGGFEFAARVEL